MRAGRALSPALLARARSSALAAVLGSAFGGPRLSQRRDSSVHAGRRRAALSPALLASVRSSALARVRVRFEVVGRRIGAPQGIVG